MFSQNFEELIDYAIKKFKINFFDSFEIGCVDRLHALTRFTKSTIHQNVSNHTNHFLFRVSKGKRICSTSLTSLTPKSIDDTISELKNMVSHVPEILFFEGFIELPTATVPSVQATDSLLDEYQRADIVEEAVNAAEEVDSNVKLAGSVFITDLRFCLINSNDIDFSHHLTYNGLIVNSLTERENKGYAKEEQYVRDPSELNPSDIARKATELSVNTCFARSYDQGEYEVILSPSATGTLLRFLSFGFNGTSYHESQSFISDEIGSQLFDTKLTLVDDPLNEETMLSSPIDGEGALKKQLCLIENGIPKTILYNSFLASKYLGDKSKTTAHKVIPYSDYIFGGAIPLNLVLQPGNSNPEEMFEETKKGFFINRLHYTNFVNRRLGAITGLTRDGLQYIENGEIVSTAKNFRFTDSLTRILKNVSLIGKKLHTSATIKCPAIKLPSFKFTGKSKH